MFAIFNQFFSGHRHLLLLTLRLLPSACLASMNAQMDYKWSHIAMDYNLAWPDPFSRKTLSIRDDKRPGAYHL